jgi:hexosaminidase
MSMPLTDLEPIGEPLLVPRPWRLECTGGWVDAPPLAQGLPGASAIKIELAHKGHEEGYTLTIRMPKPSQPATVHIWARGPRGVAHAHSTLAQIRRQYGDRWPTLEIDDAPVFKHRGVMLDISRCRIPTMQRLHEIIPQLAALKYNHLQLYTEHTFAYSGHEDVWRGWSAITPEEFERLGDFAASCGIELAANQNCFGHLSHWFAHARYADLAETHGDWMFDVWPRRGPFSLCPVDPRSIGLVRDWLGQLLPVARHSAFVNIGCDETYDVGFGRSREAVAQQGKASVYLEHLDRVASVARSHGKRPMFWADVALSHPESVVRLPKDLIALAWGYEPDSAFDHWCESLAAAKLETWVCPGTSSWCSVTGRTAERHGNLASAALAGERHNAAGFLACDWGDLGHWQPWVVSLNGLAQAAEAAWNGAERGSSGPNMQADARAIALHAFGDRSLRTSAWLDDLGDVDLELRATCLALSRPGLSGRLRNQSALFADLRTPLAEKHEVGSIEDWERARARASQQRASLATCASSLHPMLADECAFAAAFAEFMADRAVLRRQGTLNEPSPRRALRERLEWLRDEHRRQWLAGSRSGGLEASYAFFEPILAELQA